MCSENSFWESHKQPLNKYEVKWKIYSFPSKSQRDSIMIFNPVHFHFLSKNHCVTSIFCIPQLFHSFYPPFELFCTFFHSFWNLLHFVQDCGWLKPIWRVIEQEAVYTLNEFPVHHKSNTILYFTLLYCHCHNNSSYMTEMTETLKHMQKNIYVRTS